MALHQIQQTAKQLDLASTFDVLSEHTLKVMQTITHQLRSREAIYLVGEGLEPCDLGEVDRLDKYLSGLPIHEMPPSLVRSQLWLGSTVRQFKWKVTMVLEGYRKMDARMYQDFFDTTKEMVESVEATSKDISAVVQALRVSPPNISLQADRGR